MRARLSTRVAFALVFGSGLELGFGLVRISIWEWDSNCYYNSVFDHRTSNFDVDMLGIMTMSGVEAMDSDSNHDGDRRN